VVLLSFFGGRDWNWLGDVSLFSLVNTRLCVATDGEVVKSTVD
jgi:hypothetical protein